MSMPNLYLKKYYMHLLYPEFFIPVLAEHILQIVRVEEMYVG